MEALVSAGPYALQMICTSWQPVKSRGCSQTSPGTTYTLHIGVRLADRKSAFKRLNGNILATMCTNLVSIDPMISQFALLKLAIFSAIHPQFYDKSSFVTLTF